MPYQLGDIPGLIKSEVLYFCSIYVYTSGDLQRLQRTLRLNPDVQLDLSTERLNEIFELVNLMHLPGMGPDRATYLFAFDISSVSKLQACCASDLWAAFATTTSPPSEALITLWLKSVQSGI